MAGWGAFSTDQLSLQTIAVSTVISFDAEMRGITVSGTYLFFGGVIKFRPGLR
jgi:hypothetical protein